MEALFRKTCTHSEDGDDGGLSMTEVRQLAGEVMARYSGPNPVAVEVFESGETAFGQADASRWAGAYFPESQTVAVFCRGLKNRAHVERTIRHELLGHHGFGLLDDDTREEVRRGIHAARRFNPMVARYFRAVLNRYRDLERDLVAEEVYAQIAERADNSAVVAFDRVNGLLMRGLRRMGLLSTALSVSEIRELCRAAGRGIRRGIRAAVSQDVRVRSSREPLKGFYSRLRERLIRGLPNRRPAAEMASRIRASSRYGVARCEIEGYGLLSWLRSRGGESVTKEEVVKRIRVPELSRYSFQDESPSPEFAHWQERETELCEQVDLLDRMGQDAQHVRADLDQWRKQEPPGRPTGAHAPRYREYTQTTGQGGIYAESVIASDMEHTVFVSVHYPEIPNPLVHCRFAIVDDTLMIEEIQSDWFAALRRRGGEMAVPAVSEYRMVETADGGFRVHDPMDGSGGGVIAVARGAQEALDAIERHRAGIRKGVELDPADAWILQYDFVQLGLRDMVRVAAHEEVRRIAIVGGERFPEAEGRWGDPKRVDGSQYWLASKNGQKRLMPGAMLDDATHVYKERLYNQVLPRKLSKILGTELVRETIDDVPLMVGLIDAEARLQVKQSGQPLFG